MELRSSLLPPEVDSSLLAELAGLVEEIDLLPASRSHALVSAFNDLAGTKLAHEDFREYFAAGDARSFSYRRLVEARTVPTPDISREELVELVQRIMVAPAASDAPAYAELLRANGAEEAVGWIYWPPDWDPDTQTWGDGKTMESYDPSAEDIVAWLYRP